LSFIGGRAQQHVLRHRADGAVAIEFAVGRGRSAGDLQAHHRVAVDRRGRCVLGRDLRPVALELLGDQHRQARPDPLPHLDVREDDGDRVVGRDAQERVHRRQRRVRVRGGAHAVRHRERDHEARGGALQEAAA
jgi:hypothetical protein